MILIAFFLQRFNFKNTGVVFSFAPVRQCRIWMHVAIHGIVIFLERLEARFTGQAVWMLCKRYDFREIILINDKCHHIFFICFKANPWCAKAGVQRNRVFCHLINSNLWMLGCLFQGGPFFTKHSLLWCLSSDFRRLVIAVIEWFSRAIKSVATLFWFLKANVLLRWCSRRLNPGLGLLTAHCVWDKRSQPPALESEPTLWTIRGNDAPAVVWSATHQRRSAVLHPGIDQQLITEVWKEAAADPGALCS